MTASLLPDCGMEKIKGQRARQEKRLLNIGMALMEKCGKWEKIQLLPSGFALYMIDVEEL